MVWRSNSDNSDAGVNTNVKRPASLVWFFLPLLLLFAAATSCESPMDVDADRTTRSLDDLNDNTDQIEFDRSVLSFDFTERHSKRRSPLTMRNTGIEPVMIHTLEIDSNVFKIDLTTLPELPFELAPKGHPASIKTFDVLFSPIEFGDYLGNLRVNKKEAVKVVVNGISPQVSIKDLNFGTVDGIEVQSSFIQNHGETDIVISDAIVAFPIGIFTPSGLPEFPLRLKGGLSASFQVRFEPQSANLVKGRIEFLIDGADYVDNVCELNGRGR